MRSIATATFAAATAGRRSNHSANGERSFPSRYSKISIVINSNVYVTYLSTAGQFLKKQRVFINYVDVFSHFLAMGLDIGRETLANTEQTIEKLSGNGYKGVSSDRRAYERGNTPGRRRL